MTLEDFRDFGPGSGDGQGRATLVFAGGRTVTFALALKWGFGRVGTAIAHDRPCADATETTGCCVPARPFRGQAASRCWGRMKSCRIARAGSSPDAKETVEEGRRTSLPLSTPP